VAAAGADARQDSTVSAGVRRVVAPVRLVIPSSLDRRPVRLVEWTPAGARVAPATVPEEFAIDAANEVIPAAEVIAIFAPDDTLDDAVPWGPGATSGLIDRSRSRSPARVRVTLADGQRYVGSVRPAEASEPSDARSLADAPFTLQTSLFGDLVISLEHVAMIEPISQAAGQGGLPAGPEPPRRPGTDRVVLVNGDRIEGFIESVGIEVAIAPDASSGRAIDLARVPIDRVRAIEFANAAVPLAGFVAWVNDHSGEMHVVRAAQVRITASGEATILPDIPGFAALAWVVGSHQVAAFTPDASRVVPLCSIAAPEFEPDRSRRWGRPPRVDAGLRSPLGLGDVVLQGAMDARWALPSGVTALAGTVELSPESRLWGDCKVSVSIERAGGLPHVVWAGTLQSDSPAAVIGASIPDPGDRGVLRVRIEPGLHGHVHNHVTLRGFMLIRE
ncbi:MAG TPA: hypothetical protein PKU91_07355, partial [Phycisphaerales bacterium]|nr:hypothetical protein [Phycisphaerales bacterium]